MGQNYLYNDKTHKKIPLPVIDSSDMTYVIVRKDILLPPVGVVCIDEAHDLDDAMVRPPRRPTSQPTTPNTMSRTRFPWNQPGDAVPHAHRRGYAAARGGRSRAVALRLARLASRGLPRAHGERKGLHRAGTQLES